MKTTNESYNVQIWLGLKNIVTNEECPIQKIEDYIQFHCDKIGECVTITPTRFIYTKGNENGVVIGYINYPRFPKDKQVIEDNAVALAKELMMLANQCRVTVTTPENTYMFSNYEMINQIEY